ESWSYNSGTWTVNPGGWVTQPYTTATKKTPSQPELWQAGYFTQNSSGSWSWTSGKWVPKSGNYGYDSSLGWQAGTSGKYWKGETWQLQNDCYSESSTYPTE